MAWNVKDLENWDGWGSPVYYDPDKVGWEVVGEVEWEEPCYSFDLTVLWRDKESGQLFWARDSGCSCPSPFQDFNSSEQFTTGTKFEFVAELQSDLADYNRDYAEGQIAQLAEKLMLGGF